MYIFNYSKYWQVDFQGNWPIYISISIAWMFSLFYILVNTQYCQAFILCQSDKVKSCSVLFPRKTYKQGKNAYPIIILALGYEKNTRVIGFSCCDEKTGTKTKPWLNFRVSLVLQEDYKTVLPSFTFCHC